LASEHVQLFQISIYNANHEYLWIIKQTIFFLITIRKYAMAENNILTATIYTDGSCNTQLLVGAWVAIVLSGNVRKLLSGLEWNTTHNRMELTAVIKAIEYVRDHYDGLSSITICSDSQYVIGLQARKEKNYITCFCQQKGKDITKR
jgi:hypothetical protein